MAFRVTIVRHGLTDANLHGWVYDESNDKINAIGKKQAEKLGKHIEKERFTRVYCSVLRRCQQTAKACLKQLKNAAPPTILDSRIQEKDDRRNPNAVVGPKGETYIELWKSSIVEFFEDLFRLRDDCAGDENVIIFSHGLVLQYLMHYFYENNGKKYDMKNINYSYYKFPNNTCRTTFTVGKLNPETGRRDLDFIHYYDCSHLN